MKTYNERREVARKLREIEVCEFDGEFIDCGEVENALGLVSDDGAWYEAEGVTRLADLIEPSEPKVKCVAEVKFDGERLEQLAYDAAVELTGIDRDVLMRENEEKGTLRDLRDGYQGLIQNWSEICENYDIYQ